MPAPWGCLVSTCGASGSLGQCLPLAGLPSAGDGIWGPQFGSQGCSVPPGWPLCLGLFSGQRWYCFFFNKFIYLFIYFGVCWVFVSVRGLSPVVASGDHSSSRCAGLPLSRPLLLRSTGSRRTGSVVVAHGLSCSVACGICPDQGSNPCPLH